MAVYKRDIIDINLETGNIYRSWLKHSIGMADQKADHFGVRVFRNGEAVSLTGVSVQGVFMPPQGSPIAITSGNIVSGNVAEVVLPQACYNYDGQFTLAIKLVDSTNSVTGTVRIVDGMVDNTHASGTVAPTSAVPTYQEVLSVYEQAITVIGKSVRFDTDQSLTDAQKTTARTNIAAASTGELSDLKSALTSNADLNASIDSDYPITFDFPITGKYPNWASNGVLTDNANYSATNYLSVRGLKNFSFDGVTGGVYAVCFYDKNFGFISQGSGYAYKSYTVPATAYFMRMGIKTAEISTFVITKYETYLTEIKNNSDTFPLLLAQVEKTMPLYKDSSSYGVAGAKYASDTVFPDGTTILSIDVYTPIAGTLEIGYWKTSNNTYYGAKSFAVSVGLNTLTVNTEMDGDSKIVFATANIVRYVASSTGFSITAVTITDNAISTGSTLANFGIYATITYLPPVSNTAKNELHVGIGQEYTTINQAVTKAYTIESISNPITIIVHPGVYEESVNIQGKHYISIVGTNRDDCIIIDKTANYNKAPLRISGQAYVANLTMIATADSYNSTFGTGTGKTAWKTDVMAGKSYPDWLGSIMEYAVHCDDITNGEATVCRFENCKMYSECGPAFGSGMQSSMQLELVDCEIISNIDADVVNYAITTQGHGAVGQGTLLIHGKENGTNMTAVVKDCIIKANVGRVLYLYPVGSNNGAKIAFIDNSFFSDSLGSASEYYRNTFSSSAIDGISHGNNIGSLNKPNLAE